MSKLGYLVFEDPTRAIRVIEGLTHFARHFSRATEEAVTLSRLDPAVLSEASRSASAAARLLADLGIPELPVIAVSTEDDAVRAAREVGYPVALKIDSPDVQHKTEVGGVHLGLSEEASLRRAWATMIASVREKAPEARITGGTISPMLKGGVETIIGTQYDAHFGPVVMFGMGGVMAEALKDVVFLPAPISLSAARRMIDAVRARKVLDGWRGAPAADLDTLAHTVATLAALAAAHPEDIESIEINPFVALPSGGAALDVLVQLREASV
jgi:acyl-CoA synthetase (NDP forming)